MNCRGHSQSHTGCLQEPAPTNLVGDDVLGVPLYPIRHRRLFNQKGRQL